MARGALSPLATLLSQWAHCSRVGPAGVGLFYLTDGWRLSPIAGLSLSDEPRPYLLFFLQLIVGGCALNTFLMC